MFWYPQEKDYDVKDDHGVTLREFLDGYDPRRYELPAVTVDILIFQRVGRDMRLLLIRRGRHPAYGMLALPGGFIEMNETLEESAARELFEETGIQGLPIRQLGAYGDVGRDPRLRIVSIAYVCVIEEDVEFHAGDDAADAAFYRVSVKKQQGINGNLYRLNFENETDKANATIEENGGKRTIVTSQIASDHSKMILDALEGLGLVDNM